jgi:hypothetical protein
MEVGLSRVSTVLAGVGRGDGASGVAERGASTDFRRRNGVS